MLHSLRTDFQRRQGQWVALADTSAALRLALLASEDQRFYAHSGVDWQAVSAAAWGRMWHGSTRGASTITMQLAALLDADTHGHAGRRGWGQKLGQARAAQALEKHWRKDEILEAYLNLVPLRGELVGVDALSRSLFGKAPHGLNAQEAAIAAALVRSPNAPARTVGQRACQVLATMRSLDNKLPASNCETLGWRTEQVLAQRQWPASTGIAPHWARRVLAQWPQGQSLPSRIRTSIRADVQQQALDSLQRQLGELQGRKVEDGAVLVLDNASGQVLAWVGSSGHFSQAPEVDGVLAQRQVGSTLKPFLYAQALAQGRLTAASLLHDSAAHIQTGAGLYIPQNYDQRFKGWVSARLALASSLNVPAVRTLVMVGPEDFYQQLGALGLHLPQPAGYYGYSLALGSSEMRLLYLSNAYRALANGGRWQAVASPLLDIAAPPEPPGSGLRQALPEDAAFIVGHILSDPQARALTFGPGSVLNTRFWSAVKTGTSKDMRDNWAIGWSQHYTVGVWVGNASGQAMQQVSGSSGAAPIWAEVMAYLHHHQPSQPPQPPAGLEQQWVAFAGTQWDAARHEWFISGSAQPLFAVEADEQQFAAQILNPSSGTILALDPDIPPNNQRLQLQARPAAQGQHLQWRLRTPQPKGADQLRSLGQGEQLAWLPWPGRHRLELLNQQGQLLDSAAIEVRGAGVKKKE